MASSNTIDFKSVGLKETDPRRTASAEGQPIGFKTPMQIGESNDGIFAMHFDLQDQIRDNLKNLILTNHGERLVIFDFGADIRGLTMELGSDIFDQELTVRIKRAVSKWMPFIDLTTLERETINVDNKHVARINLKIIYSIPSINVKDDSLEISFFIAA